MNKEHKIHVPTGLINWFKKRSFDVYGKKKKKEESIWDSKNPIQQWLASMLLGLLFCLFVCFWNTFLGSRCESNVVRLRRMGIKGREGMVDLVSTKTKHLLIQWGLALLKTLPQWQTQTDRGKIGRESQKHVVTGFCFLWASCSLWTTLPLIQATNAR